MSCYRVDINVALLHDTKPHFPLSPLYISAVTSSGLANLPAPLQTLVNSDNEEHTQLMGVLSCIGHLCAIDASLDSGQFTSGHALWNDAEQIGSCLNPIAHQLLGQIPDAGQFTRWDVISEALRLGSLMFIIRLIRKWCSYPGTSERLVPQLLNVLALGRRAEDRPQRVWDCPQLRRIRIWLLVMCSTSEAKTDDLTITMDLIASDVTGQRPLPWARIMARIRQMPWIDHFEPPRSSSGKDYQ
jgi:hypothetical protein